MSHECTEALFLRDTQQHTMTVVRDDGASRHLRFRGNDGSAYWFDLITWPGTLCIDGDMGTYVFRRLHDMFEFFRTDRDYMERSGRAGQLAINPGYWDEKLQAPDPRDAMEYSEKKFRRHVKEAFDTWVEDNQPDDGEHTEQAVRDKFNETKEILWSELEDDVLSAASDGDVRAYDAARAFSCETAPEFDMDYCWEWDCREFKFHFIWCCYAIAWGIKTYDDAKSTQSATEKEAA